MASNEGEALTLDDRRVEEHTSFEGFFVSRYASVAAALLLVTADPHEAEELAQEAFARAWARWDQVSKMGSPVGYVYKSALNLHRSRLRHFAVEVRRRTRGQEQDPVESAGTTLLVRDALMELPLGQRQAIVLVDWLGYSAEEAAKILGIRPSSARSRISRARASLRESLGGNDG